MLKIYFIFYFLVSFYTQINGYAIDFTVINGTIVPIENVPYQVSLQNLFLFNHKHFCGGSIINANTILTAAHCVYYIVYPQLIKVLAGTNCVSCSYKLYDIRKIITHEKFDNITMEYDIAILKLKNNLRFSDQIRPIQLYDGPFPIHTEAIVTGWGITETMKLPKYLRYGELNVLPHNKCQHIFNSSGNIITETMFCAYNDHVDSCQGDSGGALTLKNPRKLIGIVSWGIDCSNYPGVYTNVTYFIDWIQNNQ